MAGQGWRWRHCRVVWGKIEGLGHRRSLACAGCRHLRDVTFPFTYKKYKKNMYYKRLGVITWEKTWVTFPPFETTSCRGIFDTSLLSRRLNDRRLLVFPPLTLFTTDEKLISTLCGKEKRFWRRKQIVNAQVSGFRKVSICAIYTLSHFRLPSRWIR